MAIVGRMSTEQFAKVKAKKAAEQQAARKRREEREQSVRTQTHLEAAKQPLVVKIDGLDETAVRLREEREEATKKALRRRQGNGRWISRTEQADSIATAEKLESLGF